MEDGSQSFESISKKGEGACLETETEPHHITNEESLEKRGFITGTPNNSMLWFRNSSINSIDDKNQAHKKSHSSLLSYELPTNNYKMKEYCDLSSHNSSDDDTFFFTRRKPLCSSESNNPYLKKTYSDSENKYKKSCSSEMWIVDMSESSVPESEIMSPEPGPSRKAYRSLKPAQLNNVANYHSISCVSLDSEGSDKSSQIFYVDMTSLPDPPMPKSEKNESSSTKKNIFSMYIDLGKNTPVKNKPKRLSKSLSSTRSQKGAYNYQNGTAEKQESVQQIIEPLNIAANFEQPKSICDKLDISDVKRKDKEFKGKTICPSMNASNIAANIKPLKPKCDNLDISNYNDADNAPIDPFNNTSTFEEIESMCADLDISLSTILATKIEGKNKCTLNTVKEVSNESTDASKKVLNPGALQKESGNNSSFVKLSDLDNTDVVQYIDRHFGPESRMTRSIPESSWRDRVQLSRIEVFASFHSENTKSLNRLFPELQNELSRSAPVSVGFPTSSPSVITRSSQGEDLSENSSQMSLGPSSAVGGNILDEQTQWSDVVGNSQSRLGQDLLRMLLAEISTDITILVKNGRKIRAHKCVLTSRCQYFAAELSGKKINQKHKTIDLQDFQYKTVQFALCHIYSGASTLPGNGIILELAKLANLLGLDGLKEVISYKLKNKYCHGFHEPCPGCSHKVVEVLTLSAVCGLDDIHSKCLQWINNNFVKIWPTKIFAAMPFEYMDKCLRQQCSNMDVNNVIDIVSGCGMIGSLLPQTRYMQRVQALCERLLEAAASFIALHYDAVVEKLTPILPYKPVAAQKALDRCMNMVTNMTKPKALGKVNPELEIQSKKIKRSRIPIQAARNKPDKTITLSQTSAGDMEPRPQLQNEDLSTNSKKVTKATNTLMCATKSSSAKVVNRIPRDANENKLTTKQKVMRAGPSTWPVPSTSNWPAPTKLSRPEPTRASRPEHARSSRPAPSRSSRLEPVRSSFRPAHSKLREPARSTRPKPAQSSSQEPTKSSRSTSNQSTRPVSGQSTGSAPIVPTMERSSTFLMGEIINLLTPE